MSSQQEARGSPSTSFLSHDETEIATGIDIVTRLGSLTAASMIPSDSTLQQDQFPAIGFSHFSNVLFATENGRAQEDIQLASHSPLQKQLSGTISTETSFWGPYVEAAEDEEILTPNPKGHGSGVVHVTATMAASPTTRPNVSPLERRQTALEDDDMCSYADAFDDENSAQHVLPLPAPLLCSSPVPDKAASKRLVSTADAAGRQRRMSHRGGGGSVGSMLRVSSETSPSSSGLGHIPSASRSASSSISSSGDLYRSPSNSGTIDGSSEGSRATQVGRGSGANPPLRGSLDSSTQAKRSSPSAAVAFGSSLSKVAAEGQQVSTRHTSLARTSLPLGSSIAHNANQGWGGGKCQGGKAGLTSTAFEGSSSPHRKSSHKGEGPLLVSLSHGGGSSPLCGTPHSAMLRSRALAVSATDNIPHVRVLGHMR